MLAVDVVAIMLLGVFRPARCAIAQRRAVATNRLWLARVGLVGGIGVAGIVTTSYLVLGQPLGIMGYVRGDRIDYSPKTAAVGDCLPGEMREIKIDLVNRGKNDVIIGGAASGYPMVTLAGIPVTIPMTATRSVFIRFKVPHTSAAYSFPVTLFTDLDMQRELVVSVSGRVSPQVTGGLASGG